MRRKSRFKAAVIAHPSVDLFFSIIPLLIWGKFGAPLPCESIAKDLFISLSTLSGLVMAAVTFVCAMTYQSESRHMQITRDRYADELSRNWISSIAWTMITSIFPLISLCVWDTYSIAATAIAMYAVALMLSKAYRSLYWLKYTLFMQKASVIIGDSFTNEDMNKARERSSAAMSKECL